MSHDNDLSPPKKKTKPSTPPNIHQLILQKNVAELQIHKEDLKEWIGINNYKLASFLISESDPAMMNHLIGSSDKSILDGLYITDENIRATRVDTREEFCEEDDSVEVDSKSNELIDKRTILCMACEKSNREVVKLLLAKKLNIDFGTTSPLFVACENGELEIVKLLLASSNNFDISKGKLEESVGEKYGEFSEYFSGTTPLYIACANGYVEIVKLLLENESIEVNAGYITPLYGASMNGHEEIVKLLLARSDIKVKKGKQTYSKYWDGFGYNNAVNEAPITIAENNKFDTIVSLLKDAQQSHSNESDEDENEEEEEEEEE